MTTENKLITTSDGSHSLLNTALNETYHSVHGALQESKHVFIKNGLQFFSDRNPKSPIRIFEMGFGTGLNALLTKLWADQNQREVQYTSLEKFPLEKDLYEQLNYADTEASRKLFLELHEARWNETVTFPNFILHKIVGDLESVVFPTNTFDLIYYDAFAPSKQPKLWEIQILEKVISWMTTNSFFVTYCAKGQLKRDLKKLGTEVETLPGPPGKKEMIRVLKF
jgi:tRNA U34 5-methylaminomethyl-2-thiouridine-forming methyltransferase MnmC